MCSLQNLKLRRKRYKLSLLSRHGQIRYLDKKFGTKYGSVQYGTSRSREMISKSISISPSNHYHCTDNFHDNVTVTPLLTTGNSLRTNMIVLRQFSSSRGRIVKKKYQYNILRKRKHSHFHRKHLKVNRLSLQNEEVTNSHPTQTEFVQNLNTDSSANGKQNILCKQKYRNSNFVSVDSSYQLTNRKICSRRHRTTTTHTNTNLLLENSRNVSHSTRKSHDTSTLPNRTPPSPPRPHHDLRNYAYEHSGHSENRTCSVNSNNPQRNVKIPTLRTSDTRTRPLSLLRMFFITCAYQLLFQQFHTFASASAADVGLKESNYEQSIAAVFNKVAYGSTTKRSIPDNLSLPHLSTVATPILTTYKYREGNEDWYRVDVLNPNRNKEEGIEKTDSVSGSDDTQPFDADLYKERRHQHKSHHHSPVSYELDLEKDHALPTSAPNADILKGNTNKHYTNPNRYSNDRSRHNLQVFGRENPAEQSEIDRIRERGSVRTYPETRRPSSLLETDSGKIASTQSSYNLLRNINPTPPMHRGELPSYSPPSRSFFTPPLPPEFGNPFADKPTLKGTNSGSTNYQNRRPIPPPSIMPKHDRIPFRPDLPQTGPNLPNAKNTSNSLGKTPESGSDTRKIFTGNNAEGGRKKVLNTPSLNVNLDKLGGFGPHTPVNESQFEYQPMVVIPSISRILSGSNGRKDAIPDVLLRTVTAKPNFQPPFVTSKPASAAAAAQPHDVHHPDATKTVHENPPPSKSKFVEDTDELEQQTNEKNIQSHVVDEKLPSSTVLPNKNMDETTVNIENDIQNLPNVNRDKNNFQIYSTKSTFLNSTNRDNFYTWNVSWNLHVYLTAILYTLLAVYSIYKIIRFNKLTHLFNQGYFIIVHLLLTTICVSRIFYLIYDPYNINLSLPKFISDILLNLPLSLLAIAFATLICYLLKRTLNKTHFKVKPIFVIIFSFIHIFLCIILHLLENFDLLGKNNNILSLVCQFIYVLLCLFLGFSYLYLYKIIKKVLSKKSQNFSELSVQNLSYATHITIAIALLFVLMSVLQIYGIFGIKSHERFSNLPPFKWLAWGFQFSIRLIEIAIIALLSWVVSLKLSVREKNIENNLSGFALFPCANSNSTVDNEIYPAICQTNQNVHNFTLRSGKSLYDDNYPLNTMDGIPKEVIARPNLGAPVTSDRSNFERTGSNFERSSKSNFERGANTGMNHFPEHPHVSNYEHASANNFERMNYERTSGSGRMTPVQHGGAYNEYFDRTNFERGSNSRNIERTPHYPGRAESTQDINCFESRYLEDNLMERQHNAEDHYENPDFELENSCRRSKRTHDKYASENLDACSVNSRSNSALGVQPMPAFTSPGEQHEQGLYNEPVDQAEYTFQKYERPNFERPSSRTNSNYSSKHLNRSEKRSNSSSSGNSGTFERRSMRKSGTLNDFGERGSSKHCGSHGYRNGIQTLNSTQKVHNYGKNTELKPGMNDELSNSMLVDENGFVRFRNMGTDNKQLERSRRSNSKSREHKNKNVYNNT